MQTYESVLARIEAGLIKGRWVLGDRLPSERALSEEFAVSRASVREALRVLEAMGIVRRSTGSGPESGAILIDKPAAGLGSAIRFHLASGATSVRDVVELRLLIETWATQAVAMRCATQSLQSAAPADCLNHARELLELMGAPDIKPKEFQQLDTQFHVEIVALAGNPLIEAAMLGVRKSIEAYVDEGMNRLGTPHTYLNALHEEHAAILHALESGDAARSSELVQAHIEGFYRLALT
jgi:GntR family transcriptional repressor for pyruvate dehydrogenase complex